MKDMFWQCNKNRHAEAEKADHRRILLRPWILNSLCYYRVTRRCDNQVGYCVYI